jgi:hypothetical protein
MGGAFDSIDNLNSESIAVKLKIAFASGKIAKLFNWFASNEFY